MVALGLKAGWNLLSLWWSLRAELLLFSCVGLTPRLRVHMSGTALLWPQVLAQLQAGGWHRDPGVCRWQSLGEHIPGSLAAGRWVWYGIWGECLIEMFVIGVPQIIKIPKEAKKKIFERWEHILANLSVVRKLQTSFSAWSWRHKTVVLVGLTDSYLGWLEVWRVAARLYPSW